MKKRLSLISVALVFVVLVFIALLEQTKSNVEKEENGSSFGGL